MHKLLLVPLLALAACDQDETLVSYGGAGTWRLSAMDGAGYSAEATMTLGTAGAVTGKAPCNSWSATQSAPYPWFDLSPIISTRRACPELQAETAFFTALSQMTLSEVAGDTLLLTNDAGREMIFTAVAPDAQAPR
ncbi:META domain-containing protein [Primorskyibacter flagellatus]|uniref:Heat shock protein HslJ n=1 Tax=Primorskyibacter flagellatus TaxID=1387277 RepID=A0A1W1ZTY0_9RHOB|nr:META domain-containing protein [Primorskyibacter flagellatus]SMC51826.1 Heat shock protein HslJ [Primorskyibacter flagellatus]